MSQSAYYLVAIRPKLICSQRNAHASWTYTTIYTLQEYLRAPEKFSKLGARPPSGVLLVGPPGTGKTLLARAVAGEADVPFFSISASEFVELYVGMGAMRVRELFANARKEAPAIVFIDEIDAVAKGRDMRLRSVGNDEREQTLNQLLTELDGFDSDKDNVVICIAATNRPDVLDQALLRPGRFDRRVSVERPDKLGRQQVWKCADDAVLCWCITCWAINLGLTRQGSVVI